MNRARDEPVMLGLAAADVPRHFFSHLPDAVGSSCFLLHCCSTCVGAYTSAYLEENLVSLCCAGWSTIGVRLVFRAQSYLYPRQIVR
jgi:hypothetical protein